MRRRAHQLLQRHQRSHAPGFTLIEVLVALVVLSIGMLGMSRITVSTIAVHTANEHLAEASALLQDSLERIKKAGYASATAGTVTDPYHSMASYSTYGGTTFNYSLYKRVTSVAAQSPATNMKTVTVTVFWQQDQQALSASTILAQ
jgi:prepilin-type N-terminal cleavage/methylation domain-containing protein